MQSSWEFLSKPWEIFPLLKNSHPPIFAMILHIIEFTWILFLNYLFEGYLEFTEQLEPYNFDFKHGYKVSKYKHTVNVNVVSINIF